MEDEALVSVIMPVHNSAVLLREAATSVLQQTYAQLEIWLVDDCSTDDSWQLMQTLAQEDCRVQLIRLESNGGAAAARNHGIHAARGRYIAFLDADDLWLPQKLERQIAFMQQHHSPLSCAAYAWMDAKGNPTGKTIRVPARISYRKLLRYNSIGCLTAMYDTQICGKQFMPNTPQRHDWGLWLSITRQFGPATGLQEVLAQYRTGSHSLSSNKWKAARHNWTILREHEQKSMPVAIWYYLQFLLFKSLKYLNITSI